MVDKKDIQHIKNTLSAQHTFRVVDLMDLLSISQPTASRIIKKLHKNSSLIRLSGGRSSCYAFVQAQPVVHLLSMNPQAELSPLGDYYRLQSGGSYIRFEKNAPEVLRGEQGNGIFEGALPFFLDDMKPEGYMGIRQAQQFVAMGFPRNLTSWSHEQILMYLKAKGDSCKGQVMVVGDDAAAPLEAEHTQLADYPSIAQQALQTNAARHSSAGGEQAKFTAYRAELGHVIVKFAMPKLDQVEQRRADLLVAEHLANQVLTQAGFAAAQTHIHAFDDVLCLESLRFDRHGQQGRSAMLSLAAVDAEYVGMGNTWAESAQKLHDMHMLNRHDLLTIQQLATFGQLIGNTDMHFGNLSLGISPNGKQWTLLPMYDMTPMALMPHHGVVPTDLNIKTPLQASPAMIQLAQSFWLQLSTSPLISADTKRIAKSAATTGIL